MYVFVAVGNRSWDSSGSCCSQTTTTHMQMASCGYCILVCLWIHCHW